MKRVFLKRSEDMFLEATLRLQRPDHDIELVKRLIVESALLALDAEEAVMANDRVLMLRTLHGVKPPRPSSIDLPPDSESMRESICYLFDMFPISPPKGQESDELRQMQLQHAKKKFKASSTAAQLENDADAKFWFVKQLREQFAHQLVSDLLPQQNTRAIETSVIQSLKRIPK